MRKETTKRMLVMLLVAVVTVCLFSVSSFAVTTTKSTTEKTTESTAKSTTKDGQEMLTLPPEMQPKTTEPEEQETEAVTEETTEATTEAPSYATWEQLTDPHIPEQKPIRFGELTEQIISYGATAIYGVIAVVLLVKKFKR